MNLISGFSDLFPESGVCGRHLELLSDSDLEHLGIDITDVWLIENAIKTYVSCNILSAGKAPNTY